MNIDGMGEQAVRSLYSAGFINTFSDIYSLSFDQIMTLPLFKEKSTQNILDAITKSKTTEFSRFITALGIRHVGEEVAELFAEHFKNAENLMNASFEEILNLHGIGVKIAQSMQDWFADSENRKEYITLVKILNSSETLASYPKEESP